MGRHGKKISFTHWTGIQMTLSAFAAGTSASNLLAAQHEPETLLRIRGNLLTYVDGQEAPGVSALISVGMILVPEGTGTTVLWSPFTDADAPWVWYETFSLGYEEYVTDVIDCPGASSAATVIDNKAMRIMRNQELQMVWENTTVSSALSVNSFGAARVLSGK